MKLPILLFAAILQASPIIGPVASGYPLFNAPCSGYESTGTCDFGEIRYLSPVGEVLTGYLFPTRLVSEPTPALPDDYVPEWPAGPDPAPLPIVPGVVVPSATPEPKDAAYVLFWALAFVLLIRGKRRPQ